MPLLPGSAYRMCSYIKARFPSRCLMDNRILHEDVSAITVFLYHLVDSALLTLHPAKPTEVAHLGGGSHSVCVPAPSPSFLMRANAPHVTGS